MIKRLLLAVVGVFALGAAAATAIVAAAFACYALLRPSLGEAGAAGAIAAAAALLAAIGGMILVGRLKGRRRPDPEPTLMDRLGDIVRQRPILAAVGALAAGVIALRNPQAAAGIVSAFLAGKAADRTQRRRR